MAKRVLEIRSSYVHRRLPLAALGTGVGIVGLIVLIVIVVLVVRIL